MIKPSTLSACPTRSGAHAYRCTQAHSLPQDHAASITTCNVHSSALPSSHKAHACGTIAVPRPKQALQLAAITLTPALGGGRVSSPLELVTIKSPDMLLGVGSLQLSMLPACSRELAPAPDHLGDKGPPSPLLPWAVLVTRSLAAAWSLLADRPSYLLPSRGDKGEDAAAWASAHNAAKLADEALCMAKGSLSDCRNCPRLPRCGDTRLMRSARRRMLASLNTACSQQEGRQVACKRACRVAAACRRRALSVAPHHQALLRSWLGFLFAGACNDSDQLGASHAKSIAPSTHELDHLNQHISARRLHTNCRCSRKRSKTNCPGKPRHELFGCCCTNTPLQLDTHSCSSMTT
jgi:hypothetical protein